MTSYDNFISSSDYILPNNYYILNLHITSAVPKNIINKYKSMLDTINSVVNYNSPNYEKLFDAGIDLYTIKNEIVNKNSLSNKIDLGINCSMVFINKDPETGFVNKTPCGYYLYPRSSTGSKTPLRLSNSIGVMDSGYRGNVIACFDNMGKEDYNIGTGERLVQICSPNITYPTLLNIVSNAEDLNFEDYVNNRGASGFGSTGR